MCRATHKGELAGSAPTGDQVVAGGMSLFEIRDGRIVRHEAHADTLPLLTQLGVDLPPELVASGHPAIDA